MKPLKYEIEVYDSRNTLVPQVTNRLITEPKIWSDCVKVAKEISKTNEWPVVARDGEQTFIAFEKGEAVEWSFDLEPLPSY